VCTFVDEKNKNSKTALTFVRSPFPSSPSSEKKTMFGNSFFEKKINQKDFHQKISWCWLVEKNGFLVIQLPPEKLPLHLSKVSLSAHCMVLSLEATNEHEKYYYSSVWCCLAGFCPTFLWCFVSSGLFL
jgi:hypothetical protein